HDADRHLGETIDDGRDPLAQQFIRAEQRRPENILCDQVAFGYQLTRKPLGRWQVFQQTAEKRHPDVRMSIDQPRQDNAIRAILNVRVCSRGRRTCRRPNKRDSAIFKGDHAPLEPVMLSIEWKNKTAAQMDTAHEFAFDKDLKTKKTVDGLQSA